MRKEAVDQQLLGRATPAEALALQESLDIDDPQDVHRLFIKNDRLYKHRIFRINYTSYDLQRAQDVINPNTSHKDIMVIRDDSDDPKEETDPDSSYQYMYARVLGVYHVNAVYTGPGSQDYQPRQLEFLWVRWFRPTELAGGWSSQRLDCISFYPVAHEFAFGFLDPADVLRSCHLIPRMALGKVHQGYGISGLSKDENDWQYYYVNRQVPKSITNIFILMCFGQVC